MVTSETNDTPGRAVLCIEHLSRSFETPSGRQPVLKDVNLCVREGDFAAVTGPSGAGKTTLLHISALLDAPTSGSVTFDGRTIAQMTESERCEVRRHSVGVVFQQFCLLPHRTALSNVLFRFRYVRHARTAARGAALETLRELGLGEVAQRQARLLSGGEMQRVAIARAVVLRPRLLIVDEPTGNLDGEASRRVMQCLRRLSRDGISILMATHRPDLLEYATRRLPLEDGRID